ncbi:MAG: PKD domain-containing protein, partial [Chitinophagaceae bacterium]
MKKLLLLLAINLLVLTTVANAKTYLPKNLTDSTCPEASFTFASHQGNGQSNSYVFVSTSFVYYGDMTYSWDFDDPGSGADNTSTLINPLHVFTTGGSKAVRLTVTNTATGCSVSSTQTINVALPASTPTPTAFSPSFTYSSTSACSVGGEIFSFSSAISAPAGSTYVWNFGDGSTATGDNPTHAYQYAGSYTVSLKALSVDNQLLGQFSAVVSAIGNNAKPTAGFSYLINTQNGNAVTFQSHSTIPSGSMTYFWDFGDGNTATTSNPTHVYTPGTSSYNVTLTVTGNPGGCSTTITQTISLVEPLLFVPNAASFTVTTPVSQCFTGHGYVFENNSLTGAGVSYIWDFGDGTTSTLHTPFTTLAPKVYSAYGDYIVKLTVIRNNDTIFTTRTVSVEPMPFADFELYVDRFANDGGPFLQVAPVPFPSPLPKTEIEQCFKYPIDFSYHSKSKIARGQMFYSWDFKTNAISYREGNSTFINPRIIFDTAGKYDVTLTVISDKGCKDSIRQTVRLSQPKGSFTVSYPQPDIRVNPLVTISLGTVRDPGYPENLPGQLTGVWTNTNGNTTPPTPVTAPAPFRYPRGGSYNPTLVVTSKIGCTNTFTQNVTFRVKPTKPVITSAVVTYNSLGQPVVALAGTGSVDETPQNLRYTWSYGVPGIGNWVHNTTTGNPTSHNKTYTIGAATASSNINLYVHNNNFNNGTLRDTALPVAVDVRIKPVLNAGVNISQSGPSASLPSASFGVGVELHDGAAAAALTYLWELYDGATAS